MSNVLVLGGKGFLGGHIVNRLIADGHDVRIFARESEYNRPEDHTGPAEVVWGDIRDVDAVDRAMDGIDIAINLVSNFRKGGSDKHEAHDINVGGTENVLQAAHKHKIERLVHCSTIGVHGAVKEIPATEETVYNPGDLYQETKLIAEQKVWDFYKETGLPTTVIRPISLIGPGDMRMLKLFKGIQSGTFFIVGKGEVYFQPAYIDDVVDGFVLAMQHENALGEAFIIGGDEYVTLNELCAIIAEELGVKPPWLYVPMAPVVAAATVIESVSVPLGIDPPLHRRRVSFFQNDRAFLVDKAKTVLGFEPKISLQEGLSRTIKWYQDNGYL